jgi:rubrerythrin
MDEMAVAWFWARLFDRGDINRMAMTELRAYVARFRIFIRELHEYLKEPVQYGKGKYPDWVCPKCNGAITDEAYLMLPQVFYAGTMESIIPCPLCGQKSPSIDWRQKL